MTIPIYTDPKFIDGFPVTISAEGNIENGIEERITNQIIDSFQGDVFTFAELGAGYGRWSAYVALYARQTRPDIVVRIIAVEPDPTHFQWLQEHLDNNNVLYRWLNNSPITAEKRVVLFHCGRPNTWYGQTVVKANPAYIIKNLIRGDRFRHLVSTTLDEVFTHLLRVDLINMDIQGEELAVLSSASEEVLDKIQWMYIGTHSAEIERGLHQLLEDRGWQCTYELPQDIAGGVTDGIQVWKNTGPGTVLQ